MAGSDLIITEGHVTRTWEANNLTLGIIKLGFSFFLFDKSVQNLYALFSWSPL